MAALGQDRAGRSQGRLAGSGGERLRGRGYRGPAWGRGPGQHQPLEGRHRGTTDTSLLPGQGVVGGS